MEENAAIGLAKPRDLLAGHDGDDAGSLARGAHVQARDARMRMGAADKGDVDHAGQAQVVHVLPPPGEQPGRVQHLHGRPDVGLGHLRPLTLPSPPMGERDSEIVRPFLSSLSRHARPLTLPSPPMGERVPKSPSLSHQRFSTLNPSPSGNSEIVEALLLIPLPIGGEGRVRGRFFWQDSEVVEAASGGGQDIALGLVAQIGPIG